MTPLQKAAQAVIDKWTHSHPLKECAVHSGVIIYLCLERDRLFDRIYELESK